MAAFAALVRRTPVVRWTGRPGVWLKLENLQRTGSFKMRGAARRLDAMSDAERQRGVVTASAGNHGLGVAAAARYLGIHAEVVVPHTSPEIKRAGIAALGAAVLVQGGGYDEAEIGARRRAAAQGAVFVSAFDDPHVVAGNGGSLAEEIFAQVPDVAQIVCAVGGGGLCGGLAAVAAPRGARVIGVQPENNCAMHDSLRLGRALTSYVGEPTIAEGCEGAIADSTFVLAQRHGLTVKLVSEAAIRHAMVQAWSLGQKIEPSAAVALAGLAEGLVAADEDASTVVVVSGGNVDADLLDDVLRGWI